MIKRYGNKEQEVIWSDLKRLETWLDSELAVIEAMVRWNMWDYSVLEGCVVLRDIPFDVERWLELEGDLHHDLNAFVEERREKLAANLRRFFHHKITSYDTEEPAFVRRLNMAVMIVVRLVKELEQVLIDLANSYRYTPMNLRTHGQEAELGSFGKRCLSWLAELRLAIERLNKAKELLRYSKMSGAAGNYGGIGPELERSALGVLDLEPFYGATQIMPRTIYFPTAEALCQIMQTVNKIALDIRLAARSGMPLMQEPFGKKQKGSSAMPHKKNTINCEKIEGLLDMALGYKHTIELAIQTWEERAIGQSSVERVAWPDLFHAVCHGLETLTKVLKGLNVYPDNMMREIIYSRGCYASAAAKDFLAEVGPKVDLSVEDAYRIIQLAAFNVFEPDQRSKNLRAQPSRSGKDADDWLRAMFGSTQPAIVSIRDLIPDYALRVSEQLEADEATVVRWNNALKDLFIGHNDVVSKWHALFLPSTILKQEDVLYEEILGEKAA